MQCNRTHKVVEVITTKKEVIEVVGRGARGATGQTAYELAVQNGFVGTEQEWLQSLKASTQPIPKEAIDVLF